VARPTEGVLARSTLAQYLRVRRGEAVTIEAWTPAVPWARAFVVEARRLGLEPVLAIEDEEGFFRSLAEDGPVPTAPAALAGFGGAYVYFPGPEAFPRLFGLRAEDLGSALGRHGRAWKGAARLSGLRAVSMTVATVSATAAARFGVNVDGWRSEVVDASVVPPRRLAAAAAPLLRALRRAREVTVRHPNGTRLELRLRPGRWSVESGQPEAVARRRDSPWTVVPTGRLILPVLPGSACGTWEANRPAYDRLGEPPVSVGARFTFVDGRLDEVAFDRGGEAFASAYVRAKRRPDVVSGLSLGLNPRVVRAPEIGDLGAGALGLRFGGARLRSRPDASGPYVSLLHGADVDLDGRPWLVGGRPARTAAARR
jgi:hypothetical protein